MFLFELCGNRIFACVWGRLSPKGVITMKKSSISQVTVICGLVFGVMALWAGAAPIGINGDQIIGGWFTYSTGNGDIGCNGSSDCDPCSGLSFVYCSGGPQDEMYPFYYCYGGSFYAAQAGAGATPHAVGGIAKFKHRLSIA
jgi:hypothetical protein